MRRAAVLLSPKLSLTGHPKRWHPGYYRPKYGASKMKWKFALPYQREVDSLLHYPDISRVTGMPVDWFHGEPRDGYEAVRMFGAHTLELQGMPMGRTPEYLQERLRRFFSKFGPVVHCRAEPHPLDPYQCQGTAFVTFRDRRTALQALRAPLRFPASLHDKVISMRHLDSDKQNDPEYHMKSRFWNEELISVARQLHIQLCRDPTWRVEGKPLSQVFTGILERELVQPAAQCSQGAADGVLRATSAWPASMWGALPLGMPSAATATVLPLPTHPGRGGVPVARGLHRALTRRVPAGPAVHRRFGSWEAFLAEPPLDRLFRLDYVPVPGLAKAGEGEAPEDASPEEDKTKTLVVRPRLVSATQRARILGSARTMLKNRLHDEFSRWWREGKLVLPEYTQRRVGWWQHKPALPMDLQIMSRPGSVQNIFSERFLYRHQLIKARNAKRAEVRAAWKEERNKLLQDHEDARQERRKQALEAAEKAKRDGAMGRSFGLVTSGGVFTRGTRRNQNPTKTKDESTRAAPLPVPKY